MVRTYFRELVRNKGMLNFSRKGEEDKNDSFQSNHLITHVLKNKTLESIKVGEKKKKKEEKKEENL